MDATLFSAECFEWRVTAVAAATVAAAEEQVAVPHAWIWNECELFM